MLGFFESRGGLGHLLFVVIFLCVSSMSFGGLVSADEEKTEPSDSLSAGVPPPAIDNIVVTATRTSDLASEIPRSINVVDEVELYQRNVLSIVDALDDSVGIWVEKRTTTTSDPVIRGLSGSNLLALIDGNTLSTFWGEGGFGGDDMYGKIDADMVDRIEVLRGPMSVQYGSNALGGVLNFFSRSSPFDYSDSGPQYGGRIKAGYGSAADESRLRTELFGSTRSLRYILGFSARDVNDVEGGRGVGTQTPTSGEDRNFDGKLQWKTSEKGEVTLAVQNVHREHLHRYYRPNQDNENFRQGYSATYAVDDPAPFWNQLKFNLYYQYKEDRRRYFDTGNEGKAKWWTYTGDLQMLSYVGEDHRFVYGVSFHRDKGESPDDEQFTITEPDGTTTKAAPDTVWDNVGVYLTDFIRFGERLTVTAGVRYDAFRFDSNPDRLYVPPGGHPELDDFTARDSSVTGGIGASYRIADPVHVYVDYSRGFRQFAPNFGIRELGVGVLVPNQFLDPITADNYEVGAKWASSAWNGTAAVYYTHFDNFQNIVSGSYDGQDWFDFNGNGVQDPGEDVFVTTGSGKAYVYGVEIGTNLYLGELLPRFFGPEWSVGGSFTWNYGNDQTNDVPLEHTQPARGLIKLRWDDYDTSRGFWWEFTADMVRHYDRVPPDVLASDPGYLNDPQDPGSGPLRDDGLPGYTVYDLRGGVNLTHYAALVLAVENLTNKKYRTAHSRMDAPGINFLVSLELVF